MSSVPGGKILLIGSTGSGKTHSLRTLPPNVTGFGLFTENSQRTVSDIGCDRIHWKYVPAATVGWDTMLDNASKINNMSFQALTGMKDGMSKKNYGQFIQLLSACQNYVCDRCGESFGAVDDWGTDRLLFVDSLSGLNIMVMDLVVGAKPVKAMGEWGVAMDTLERFVNQICMSLSCHVVLTGHLDREVDEVQGGTTVMAQALGKKLGPRLPRYFDDVVLAKRDGKEFSWSNADSRTDLKARNLPISDKIEPSLARYIELWEKAGGVIQADPHIEESV